MGPGIGKPVFSLAVLHVGPGIGKPVLVCLAVLHVGPSIGKPVFSLAVLHAGPGIRTLLSFLRCYMWYPV